MVANRVGCVSFFGMPIKTLGSLGKIRVGRVTGNTHIFFFCLMMNIKDVKPVSKTCIFFIQYVTLVTASNNELFITKITMYSQMKLFFYQILSIMKF